MYAQVDDHRTLRRVCTLSFHPDLDGTISHAVATNDEVFVVSDEGTVAVHSKQTGALVHTLMESVSMPIAQMACGGGHCIALTADGLVLSHGNQLSMIDPILTSTTQVLAFLVNLGLGGVWNM